MIFALIFVAEATANVAASESVFTWLLDLVEDDHNSYIRSVVSFEVGCSKLFFVVCCLSVKMPGLLKSDGRKKSATILRFYRL